MKTYKAMIAVAVSCVAVGAWALDKAAKNYVITPASDVKWNDVPKFPEVKMSVVEGDSAKGAHHSLMKFNAGFTAPTHQHTADHYVTVVQGTLTLIIDGVETKLGPGSYFQFTKKQMHGTRCEAGTDCIIFADVRGKWDVIPEKKEAKADMPAGSK